MPLSIKSLEQLHQEKSKIKAMDNENMKGLKESLIAAKGEGRDVLLKKILLPFGALLLAGYGTKKIIQVMRSGKDKSDTSLDDRGNNVSKYHPNESPSSEKNTGYLSNIDWKSMIIRMTPILLSVGKKMYDEGNLPFLSPRDDK